MERRKAEGHIQEAPDPLVVAKLAVIEQEWSDKFEELARQATGA